MSEQDDRELFLKLQALADGLIEALAGQYGFILMLAQNGQPYTEIRSATNLTNDDVIVIMREMIKRLQQ